MKVLLPLSWLYRIGFAANRALYHHGVKKSRRVSVPVICIGNLSVGGTGKTPMVIYAVDLLKTLGFRPAIVSRGYRRKSPARSVVLVSDGTKILADAGTAGDEPVLLARKSAGTAVAVCAERSRAADYLIERQLCDAIVLDDGFQHMALQRDADIVLIDATHDLARMHLLPAGRLRELPPALSRATAVVHTRSTEGACLTANQQLVTRMAPNLEQFTASFVIQHLHDLTKPDQPLSLEWVRGKRILAAAGIGNPDSFFQMLKELGGEVEQMPLPDHATMEREQITAVARNKSCDAVLITEKDLVKLPQGGETNEIPWYTVVGQMIVNPQDRFRQLMLNVLERKA